MGELRIGTIYIDIILQYILPAYYNNIIIQKSFYQCMIDWNFQLIDLRA